LGPATGKVQRALPAGELVGLGDGLGVAEAIGEGDGGLVAWLDGVGEEVGAFAWFDWQAVAAMARTAKDAQARVLTNDSTRALHFGFAKTHVIGAPPGIRTPDPLLRRQMLYPLS
jgi:hypothetical protein